MGLDFFFLNMAYLGGGPKYPDLVEFKVYCI